MAPTLDPCIERLRDGDHEGAWNLFVDRYRRLIFSVIRRYATDPDEVMDLFAHICERLHANDLARLRRYPPDGSARASFSTWLVAVTRNLIVDWYRMRDGRSRAKGGDDLSPLARRIRDYVFTRGYSHRETQEVLCGSSGAGVGVAEYQRALRELHRWLFSSAPGAAWRPVAVDGASYDPQASEAEDVDPAETAGQALQALSPDVRMAVTLFVVEEMPAADIARVLGLPNAKSVYNKVYRGIDALRRALAQGAVRSRGQ
jgi:RNA polymerase sigma factor (sigma-70 family)